MHNGCTATEEVSITINADTDTISAASAPTVCEDFAIATGRYWVRSGTGALITGYAWTGPFGFYFDERRSNN